MIAASPYIPQITKIKKVLKSEFRESGMTWYKSYFLGLELGFHVREAPHPGQCEAWLRNSSAEAHLTARQRNSSAEDLKTNDIYRYVTHCHRQSGA